MNQIFTDRPWGTGSPEELHWAVRIPWTCFTYGMDLDTGLAHVVPEQFQISRDTDGNIATYRKVAGTIDNYNDWPLMTFEQVCKTYDLAAEKGIAVKFAYVELFGLDHLSRADQKRLAKCPPYLVNASRKERVEDPQDAEAAIAELRAAAGKAEDVPVETGPKIRRRRSIKTPE